MNGSGEAGRHEAFPHADLRHCLLEVGDVPLQELAPHIFDRRDARARRDADRVLERAVLLEAGVVVGKLDRVAAFEVHRPDHAPFTLGSRGAKPSSLSAR
jgi:hypothetical protein